MDDVWEDDNPDDDKELVREWQARQARYSSAGIRDGIDEGKSQTVQAGFDDGFRRGVTEGLRAGSVQGAVTTLFAFAGQVFGTSVHMSKVTAMHEELRAHDKEITVRSCHKLAQSDPGDGCPTEGTSDRLAEAGTGLERWQGLATSINIDLQQQQQESIIDKIERELLLLDFMSTCRSSESKHTDE